MFYAILDKQTGAYLHSGRNVRDYKELEEALRSFVEPDLEVGENVSIDYILEAWQLDIHSSPFEFGDE